METLSNSIGPITKYITKKKKPAENQEEYDKAMKLFGLVDKQEEKRK